MNPKPFAVLAAAVAIFAAAPAPAQTPAAPVPATAPAAPVTPPLVLATVAADDPAVKAALAATDVDGARKLLDKSGAFQGTVTQVVDTGEHLILEFAPKRTDALFVYIAPTNYTKFAGLSAAVQGKRVLISGTFVNYKGHTEIIMTDPTQIKLVQ